MDDYYLYSCEHSCLSIDINEKIHIDPVNYCDAMKSQESDLWLEAMNEEINSMKNNGV